MSSPSNQFFECHWQASRLLLVLYSLAQGLAIVALVVLPVPFWLQAAGLVLCLIHAGCVVPSQVLLTTQKAWRGLRHDDDGWYLWSRSDGWQPVQLHPDSLALPLAVVLRFKRPGQWFARGICIPRDAMRPEQHRRLRLRLKFSRRRWAAPG